ncbi:hypothetical protein [Paenibacillus sp. HB172176]|uniref:hypothetical protein n=1 Tax=Paenibacillus sp. HB172176 TaxID=2493690 RepID=UPI00143916CF|nr:hypothetical protein [Paenibacillus sp. HB172176]
MEQIYPLTEQRIQAYAGMNVCAVLKTGFRQFGLLERCSGGAVYMGEAASTTNYAKKQQIPSSKISAASDKNVAKIELSDIAFLLLLV